MATVDELKQLSILEVAESLGMSFKRVGNGLYSWEEHDSFIINTHQNLFNWFSRQQGGDVFGLVQLIREEQTGEKTSFKEAKHFLEEGNFETVQIDLSPKKDPFSYYLAPYEKPFREGRAYLKEERKLSDETIDFFLDQGVMSQATKKTKDFYEPVIVFKTLDRHQKHTGASLQGIEVHEEVYDRGRLKQIMKNSDGSNGLNVTIGQPKRLIFAEAPIDLMSYYELHKDELSDVRLVAMDGLKEGVIGHQVADLLYELGELKEEPNSENYSRLLEAIAQTTEILDKHPDFITLAVDNDESGRRFLDKLEEQNIPFKADLPTLPAETEKMDWNDQLKQEKASRPIEIREETQEPYRLRQARQKLERLEREQNENIERLFSHQKATNGQPMNDKRNGAAFFNRRDQLEGKVLDTKREIEQQRQRIEDLERQAAWQADGWAKRGNGLEMSVANIPRIRAEIEAFDRGEGIFTRATIKRYRSELERLEAIAERAQNTNIQEGAQFLIDSGELNQWTKQPTIYFLKGRGNGALELNQEGLLEPSKRYVPQTEEAKANLERLLKLQDEHNQIKPEKEGPSMDQEEQEKALDRDQELNNIDGEEKSNEDEKKNENTFGDLPGENQEAAPLPATDNPLPLNDSSPNQTQSQSLLHFSMGEPLSSTIYKRNYHSITESELRKLNRYAPHIQEAARWYLDNVADSTVTYFYKEGSEVKMVEVEFREENFMHLTGIAPLGENQSPAKTLRDFAEGKGHFEGLMLSNRGATFDKLKVLPELPAMVEADAFYFGDLSDVEKLHKLDLDKAIRSSDQDVLLALRTVDGTAFPASLMKLRGSLNLELDKSQQEKAILGIYRERDGQIEQLSINPDYIKDGGTEMLVALKKSREKEARKQEELARDTDGDGVPDAVERDRGTNPYTADTDGDGYSDLEDSAPLSPDLPEKTEAVKPEKVTPSISDLLDAKDTAGLSKALKEGVADYLDSDQYKTYLTAMSKFHNYSPRNIQMILKQVPDASMVAPLPVWNKEFDRKINKGSKAIRIFVPAPTKMKNPETGEVLKDKDGKPIIKLYFKMGTVFDVSQTNGKELPRPIYEIQGSYEDYGNLYQAAKEVAAAKNIDLSFSEDTGGANGFYDLKNNRIVIKKGMSEQHTLKTVFHELAHADLHKIEEIKDGTISRSTAELQAESVAFVVANHYGIDTSEYSFGYLAAWSKDKNGLEDLQEQIKVVQEEAHSLITRLDKSFEKYQNKELKQDALKDKINQIKYGQKEKPEPEKKKGEVKDSPKKSEKSDENLEK